jgi:hypothetical protein
MLAPTVKDGLLRILLCDYPIVAMCRRQVERRTSDVVDQSI